MGLAALAGVLIFLSFPLTTERDSNLWPLAWFALVPLLEALRGLNGRQGFWLGAWCGLVTNFGGFWWISEVLRDFGHLPPYVYWPLTLLNSAYQGMMFAVFGLVYARTARRLARRDPTALVPIWQTAAIFTVVEFLFPMIFPWYLGNGQYRFLPAIQVAELGGVMAVTFTMVAFNAALHKVVAWRLRGERTPTLRLGLAFGGVLVVLVYGAIRVAQVDADIAAAQKLKLGLVEADIGIFEKQAKGMDGIKKALTLHRNLLKHQHMSAELARAGADLVVWPESSYFPLSEPLIKRLDTSAYVLSEVGLSAVGPGLPPTTLVKGAFLGASSPREDIVALLAPDLVQVVRVRGEASAPTPGEPLVSRLPVGAGDPAAVALVEAPGLDPGKDGAKVKVWVVTRQGRLFTGAPSGDLVEVPRAAGPAIAARAIAMRAGRDGVVVGDGVVEIAEGQARRVELAEPATLNAVAWGPEREAALAVGVGGEARLRLDGVWRKEDLGVSEDLLAVAFADSGEAWVGGRRGVVRVRRQSAWRNVDLPVRGDVRALAVDPFGVVWVAAEGGVWTRAPADTGWTRMSGLEGSPTALLGAGWVVARAFPRDVRWVRQAPSPLTPLSDFDEHPALELSEVPERDRGALQRGFTTPLLFGGITWDENPKQGARRKERSFNTAMMVDAAGRVIGTYDKVFLLAFGEFMPLGDTFPKLYEMFPQAGDFTAGEEARVFDYRGVRIGIMICYEDIMADFTGKLAKLEPNLIVNVTNDAWFGRTSEPWLHLALAVFRSVENRLELVRSTNTGISAFIDATGRITAATRIDDPETLLGDVAVLPGGTLYSLVGNFFAWLLLGGLVAEWLWHRRPRSGNVKA